MHWQALDISRQAHAALKQQRSKVLWFTGLSGAGKATIVNLVKKKLHVVGKHTFLLDGDNAPSSTEEEATWKNTGSAEYTSTRISRLFAGTSGIMLEIIGRGLGLDEQKLT